MKRCLIRSFVRAIALVLGLVVYSNAWAVDKTNPVTGETESYSNVFTGGTSSEWNLADNWTLATASKVPFVSGGDYNAALVDGKTATSASTAIDGWQLRVGAYNGATVTWSNGIAKIQASNTGCWLTADETSSITIASFANKQLEGSDTYPFKLSSANAGGITWSAGLTGANNTSLPFWYYLKGAGTVVYGGDITVANAQVIKQADVSLSGSSKSIENKDLVTFGSGTTKAFTANASVSIKQSNVTKTTRTLKSVTAGGAPVKLASVADWQVGTCELVQTSTGVKLYYVDGDYDTSYMAYVGDDPSANRYYSVAAALDAIEADDTLPKKITLLLNTEEDIVIPTVGFVFDSNGKAITGTISGASGVGLSESAGVYTGISNTAATWTGSASDNLWSNAQNWSTKSVPTSATTVTFDTDATVEMGETAEIYGLVVNSGKTFTLYRTGNSAGNQNSLWATLKIGAGQVVGGGTVKLICAGISKTVGSFTINANIEFQNNGSYDSFLEETASGSFVINGTVTGSGYLQVKTSTTFNGNVTIPAGSSIKVNSWTYILGNSASLSGAGTLIFDGAGVQNSFKTAVQDSTKWTGTCELRSLTISNIDFADYGNENSYVGANGLSGTFKGSGVCRIADGIKGLKLTGNGLTVGGWSTDHTYVIAADISGAGPINLNIQSNAGDPLNAPASIDKVVFTGSTSDFTGQVSFKQTSYRPCYVFANESDLESLPTPSDYGQIIVMAGKTVNVGAAWSAPGGFFLNGVANVSNDNGSFADGSISGSGKVSYYGVPTLPASGNKQLPKNIPSFSGSWSGDIEIQAVTISNKTQVNLSTLSADNRKLILKGINRAANNTSIFLDNYSVKGTVQVDGPVFITDGNSNKTYAWNKVTGSGNMTLTRGAGSASGTTHAITTLDDYTGTLETTTFALTIGAVNVSSLDLTVGDPIVKLATGCNLTTDPANIAVKVGNEATEHKLYKASDGHLYIKVASVTVDDTTTYYPTLQAAADAAMAAGGETIQFTRIDSEASTSLPGWTYENGVFTRTGYAYNATTATEYASLTDAVAAATAGDTIQLMYANSEVAVDTTGKNFIFDENGYEFRGTWTGSGRIVLSAAPSTTTWSSAKFVADGWTGTVALDWGVVENRATNGDVTALVNKYGTANSTVEIGKDSRTEGNCYFNGDPTPKLKVSGYLYINDGSSGTKRYIGNVCGDGVFVFGDKANTVNYGITNLNDWNGILTNKSAKVTVGAVTRGNGIIYSSNKPTTAPTFTDTEGNRWTGRFIVGWNQTSSAAFAANSYGISGSIVEIPEGITILGFIPSSGNATLTVNPTINVAGSLTIDNGYSGAYTTFSKITGSGNFEISSTQQYYFVDTLENWTGHFLCSTGYSKIINLVSGSGEVKFNRAPTVLPTTIGADWAGSFVMNWTPSYDSTPKNTAWVLDNYGVSGSTVVIAQAIEHGYRKDKSSATAPSIAPAVYLKANLTVDNGFYNATTTFSQLGADEGVVFKTRSSGDGTPYAVTLLKDFAGSFNLLYGSRLTIDTIERNALPSAGDLVVSATAQTDTSTPASFNVASTKIRVAGVDTVVPLAYSTSVAVDESGLYKAVAQISTTYYATMQEAITAAGDNNLASIMVLDATAELPDEYYISNGSVCKYLAYVSKSGGDTVTYCKDAIEVALQTMGGANTYEYVMVLQSGDVELMWYPGYKIKNPNGATITFANVTEEYTLEYTDEDGLRTYANEKSNRATTYTWTGADSSEALLGEERTWGANRNWTFVDSSSTVTTATRCPQAGDTVVVGAAATISLGVDATAAEMQISGDVVFCKVSDLPAQVTRTITLSSGAVLTGAATTLTVSSGVTLSPEPTVADTTNYRVRKTTAAGTTTYTVVDKVGTIFSVY